MRVAAAPLLKRFRGELLAGLRCLSVRQPWASLIASGRKSIELRTWRTDYRGPLIICSALGADPERVERWGDGPRGMALCVVDLIDVREAQRNDAFNACTTPTRGCFAWTFRNPQTLRPVAIKGKLNFFTPTPAVLREVRHVR